MAQGPAFGDAIQIQVEGDVADADTFQHRADHATRIAVTDDHDMSRAVQFDAASRLELKTPELPEPAGCRCAEVLLGGVLPTDCALFGEGCTPESPVGPCMVSSEGSCAAEYRYGEALDR